MEELKKAFSELGDVLGVKLEDNSFSATILRNEKYNDKETLKVLNGIHCNHLQEFKSIDRLNVGQRLINIKLSNEL